MKYDNHINNVSTSNTTIHQVALVSNITLEPWFSHYLETSFAFDQVHVKVASFDLSSCRNEMYDPFDAIVVLISLEELFPKNNISPEELLIDGSHYIHSLYDHFKLSTMAPVIWIGFEDFDNPIRYICGSIMPRNNLSGRLNEILRQMLLPEDTYLDFPSIIAQIGVERAYSPKNRYRWNAPYSCELIARLCAEIHKIWKIYNSCRYKCLVLDCDNVLWKGTLADDGITGIVVGDVGLGRAYQDFQKFVLELYYRGIILALCTKNDSDSIRDILNNHSGMILHEEHFACICANWDNKPDNLRTIAELLNIGVESLAFVDDSPYEIGMVSEEIPEIKSILFQLSSIYSSLSCFNVPLAVDLQRIEIRNQTFRTNVQREKLKCTAISNESYLQKLNTQVDIHEASNYELNRIAELVMRTNRCTNGLRYNLASLREACNCGMKLFSVTASDRFSDLGLVGAIGISGETLKIFALSCRVLGRNIEDLMISIAKENMVRHVETANTGKNDTLCLLLHQKLEEVGEFKICDVNCTAPQNELLEYRNM